MYFPFEGENARIPIPIRCELLRKWLRQEEESREFMQRHGENIAGYERRIAELRAQLESLTATA